jgi:redox-sensitive bicupin YhaK (pirin superfamily)
MITIRKSDARGHANYGWLDTRHTFSFANYHDPQHMAFRSLRVINEDRVAGGSGFDTHPHRDMEIITVVLSGALEHRDSLGHRSVMKPGEVQRISAGTGIEHSEYNYSPVEPVHLLQIWILPERRGLTPGYEQKSFPPVNGNGSPLRLVASHDSREGSLHINQDADLYVGTLDAGALHEHALKPKRHAWVQVARGRVKVNDQVLEAGDGAAISEEKSLRLEGETSSQVLFFDLS